MHAASDITAQAQVQPQTPPPPSSRLEGLDALRGVAALCVLYFHVLFLLSPIPELRGKGYLAVDFFFMLSGYIMARTYEGRFAGGYGARSFLWARYRRLWPVMMIGALIGAPMLAVEARDLAHFLLIAVPNVLMLPTFVSNVIFPINVAAWSIFAELVVNLLHVVLLWRLRSRVLLMLAAALIPVLAWLGITYETLDIGANIATWPTGIPRALFSYTVGILIWRRWGSDLPVRPKLALAFLGLPLLLLPPLFIDNSWWFDLGFIMLASPLLIASGLAYRGRHWALRWLGTVSFPLYAVNMPLLHWARGLGLGPLGGFVLAIAVASAIAWVLDPARASRRRGIEASRRQDIERGRTLPG